MTVTYNEARITIGWLRLPRRGFSWLLNLLADFREHYRKSRYCSDACRMRAYRRRKRGVDDEDAESAALR